jgi:hypothetical protein
MNYERKRLIYDKKALTKDKTLFGINDFELSVQREKNLKKFLDKCQQDFLTKKMFGEIKSLVHFFSDFMPSTGPQSNSSLRDNRAHRGTVGEFLKSEIQPGSHLSFVSAYFTVHACEALASQLEGAAKLRFLFGEPSFVTGIDRGDKGNEYSLIWRIRLSSVVRPTISDVLQFLEPVTRLAGKTQTLR